jgi:hypothetical protein
MARGFESKDVEFQQAEAERIRKSSSAPLLTAAERAAADARRSLELALADLRRQRAAATHPRHRDMLEAAIRDVEMRLADGAVETGKKPVWPPRKV